MIFCLCCVIFHLVAVARSRGFKVAAVIAAEDEALGVNDRAQLAAAELILQARLRAKAMREGAIDPSSVTLAFDTRLGRDAVVEPHVVFGPGVSVGEGSRIRSFSCTQATSGGHQGQQGSDRRCLQGRSACGRSQISPRSSASSMPATRRSCR